MWKRVWKRVWKREKGLREEGWMGNVKTRR
jgi:hypothetical protein